MIPANENLWRISLTSSLAKGYWRDIGIPRPSNWLYAKYSQAFPQGQGGQTIQGYLNIILIWDRLNRHHLQLLESYRTGVAGGLLYLTIDRANGQSDGFDWCDISCYPGVIQYANEPLSRGNVKTGVQMSLNNIVILNAPASF